MKTHATISLIILIAAFLGFTVLNHAMLGGFRLDLTENQLYTLSEGTEEIVESIDEPINLYFFFSEKASEDLTSLRAYANRVREMLEEYELAAGSKINLKIIDPEPFSEEEDQAAAFGLQSVPVNQSGDELYFGLVGTNAVDGQEVIPFFQPDKEAFLEYELTKLVYALSSTAKPKVGIYSGLQIDERVDPQSYQATPAWVFLSQLQELYAVDMLRELEQGALDDIDLLVVIHPKNLSEKGLFVIDQHVMKGNRLIAFVDPMAELEQPANPGMNMPGSSSSDLNGLTGHWGVKLRTGEILADAETALMVGGGNGAPVRHLGILGYTVRQLSREDVVTASLETVNSSTSGIFDVDEVEGIVARPLLFSSESASSLPAPQFQFLTDPADLQKGFSATGESYVTAVRLSGRASTAFPNGVAGAAEEIVRGTEDLQVVLFADTDLLSDRLWVQVQNFFGSQIASAFADNGSLITNLVENLSGSSALIDVRSRGQFTRPFAVVEALRREAEARYLESAEDLQARLAETERQLMELESSSAETGLLTLTPEQEAALNNFQNEKLNIRKELRDVRHRLDQDIEALGTMLKLINILLMPLLLTLILIGVRTLRLNRREAVAS